MASISKMSKSQAMGVGAFYRLLDTWFKTTNEATIGDVVNHQGRVAWVWIAVGGERCKMHADTTRDGV